jgi:hypothetical protein
MLSPYLYKPFQWTLPLNPELHTYPLVTSTHSSPRKYPLLSCHHHHGSHCKELICNLSQTNAQRSTTYQGREDPSIDSLLTYHHRKFWVVVRGNVLETVHKLRNLIVCGHLQLAITHAIPINHNSVRKLVVHLQTVSHSISMPMLAHGGLQVLTVVAITFWDITLFSLLKVNQCFKGTYHLHLQGRRISQARNQCESKWQAQQTLKIEAICSSKMSADFQRTIRCHIPRIVLFLAVHSSAISGATSYNQCHTYFQQNTKA